MSFELCVLSIILPVKSSFKILNIYFKTTYDKKFNIKYIIFKQLDY